MRTTKNISITLPPSLLKQATTVAKKEGRTQSELFREALRKYLVQHQFEELAAFGRRQAKAQGFKPSDANRLIKEYRAEKQLKTERPSKARN